MGSVTFCILSWPPNLLSDFYMHPLNSVLWLYSFEWILAIPWCHFNAGTVSYRIIILPKNTLLCWCVQLFLPLALPETADPCTVWRVLSLPKCDIITFILWIISHFINVPALRWFRVWVIIYKPGKKHPCADYGLFSVFCDYEWAGVNIHVQVLYVQKFWISFYNFIIGNWHLFHTHTIPKRTQLARTGYSQYILSDANRADVFLATTGIDRDAFRGK